MGVVSVWRCHVTYSKNRELKNVLLLEKRYTLNN